MKEVGERNKMLCRGFTCNIPLCIQNGVSLYLNNLHSSTNCMHDTFGLSLWCTSFRHVRENTKIFESTFKAKHSQITKHSQIVGAAYLWVGPFTWTFTVMMNHPQKKEKEENTTSAGHNLNGHNSSEFIKFQLSSALFWRDNNKEF